MDAHRRVGVIARLPPEGSPLAHVREFGLSVCQLCCWQPELLTDARADAVRAESRSTGVRITSLWAGWPGPAKWNFTEGPATLGIVPREYRAARVAALERAGPFAKRAGLAAVVTHLGFIPENPGDPLFAEVVATVRGLAGGYRALGLEFWFETGQETPVALLRLIAEVGTGNLGVNLDPANLILYGKANPVDALDVFGRHVRSVHAKDGLYPNDPSRLGREVKVGEGRVRFPEFVRALEGIGYRGDYIIEREISGPQQRADIAETVRYLGGLLGPEPR
jgi:sugar phosphate isomerase/epimerase